VNACAIVRYLVDRGLLLDVNSMKNDEVRSSQDV
jgi:hypothetical protein